MQMADPLLTQRSDRKGPNSPPPTQEEPNEGNEAEVSSGEDQKRKELDQEREAAARLSSSIAYDKMKDIGKKS
jgi:hypothetical protein